MPGAPAGVQAGSPNPSAAPVAPLAPMSVRDPSEAGSSIQVGQRSSAKSADVVVASWRGSSNMQTRPFHVDGPWELQWRNSQGFFGVRLHRTDGSGPSDALIANGAVADSSSAYQPTGGDFYLEIGADAPWSIQAVLVAPKPGLVVNPNGGGGD